MVFQNQIFFWLDYKFDNIHDEFDEEYSELYKGDLPLCSSCHVYNLTTFSFEKPREGFFINKKKLLTTDSGGGYCLFDLGSLSLDFCSSMYDQSKVYYDALNERIILATRQQSKKNYSKGQFCLNMWDLQF